MSGNFTTPVALSGKYSVIAFDLENNNMSAPRIPMSVVADEETCVIIQFILRSGSLYAAIIKADQQTL